MPNHVHAIIIIRRKPTNEENHLSFLVGRFKGATAFLYGRMKRAGIVPDISEHLWQFDYWDDLITSEDEFRHYECYIRDNPRNWSRDRWGTVTAHMLGVEGLLNCPKLAFVASQGFPASALAPRYVEPLKRGASVPLGEDAVLISTFTSAQEREVLHRALAKKRLVFISPQPSGSRLNKKVATWCNEYVLRQAQEVRVGDISPNGMLSTMIDALVQEEGESRN